jgi:hypothetical protein
MQTKLSPEVTEAFIYKKLIAQSVNRKQLIGVLKRVIRHKHKIQRQITRKYEVYQGLEGYQDAIKKRIRQLTTFSL